MNRPYRIPISALLFTTLGLTACNTQVPRQPQYQVAGHLAIRFTLQGDQVTTEVVPQQSIAPQRHQGLPSFPAITVLGSTGIKDQTNNSLYITGMYKFTNTFGRELKNVLVVPITLDDTDGNATNNATTPTVGATPYKSLKYFNGTDASVLATTLTPQQGKIVNLKTGDVINNPEASPFGTVDLTGATFTGAAGLSANFYGNQAWQLGNIPAGGTAYLTMGNSKIMAANPTQEIYTFSIEVTILEEVN